MKSLEDAIDAVERQRKTLDVYTDEDAVAQELETQFSTRNVRVTHESIPSRDARGFVVVRSADDSFQGALGIDQLQAVLSPDIHPPWTLDTAVDGEDLFDFLDNTVFTSYDRRQMLAAAREIEERAWRAGTGRLYVGFQRREAVAAQAHVYDRFADETDVDVRLFIADEWDETVDEAIEVVSETNGEIGRFWFVIYDGGGSDLSACGLLAEEREPERYYGFWTYDPGHVDVIITYLDAAYGE